ncbi:MAG TPA: alpha/beta hydrolase [Caulobacteraceae bacterium]|jgi:pimeloyl-ACP methyl ester carboxylesterase
MKALIAAGLVLAFIAAPAAAQRLFPDSKMFTGERISAEVVGSGPDVVLIPGLASSRETWRATAERLKGRYRLHLIQVAGFAGEAAGANAKGPVVIPTAEAIDAYIVAAHLSPATVVGHSLGGTIALWLAEHHPEHLKKVLLVDALPFVSTVFISPTVTLDQATKIAEGLRNGPPQPDAARERMIEGMVTGEKDRAMVAAWGKASDPAVVGAALADDMELDLRPGLGAITTPITLVYPFDATMGIPGAAWDQVYAGAYAPAHTVKLERVDGARHFVMLDAPKSFAADLDAFLAK